MKGFVMVLEIKAPNALSIPKIFLAGSIDQGKAEEWQKTVVNDLKNLEANLIVFNPRRDEWDSSWVDGDSRLKNQIYWELKYLKESNIIFYYFDPKGQAPVTMLEFGKYIGDSSKKLIVVCPDGFWRKANVVQTALFYGHDKVFNSLDEGIIELRAYLNTWFRSDFVVSAPQTNLA